jgi:hypothetical protein
LLNNIDFLYIKAETQPLSMAERDMLKNANECVNKLRRGWEQYQVFSSNYKWKEKIFQLEQDEGTIVGEDNLKVYIP